MPDEVTSDDLKESAATNASEGISSVSVDGMTVSALDPIKQLDVADRLDRRNLSAAGRSPASTLGNTVRAISPGAYT